MSGPVLRFPISEGGSPVGRYGVAIAITSTVIVIKLLFADTLGFSTPFLLIETAIWFAVLFGGIGPGVLTAFLSSIATMILFVPDEPDGRSTYALYAALFLLQAIFILWVGSSIRRSVHDLDRTSSLFRSFMESAPSSQWIKDANGSFAMINRRVEQFLGMSKEEVIGRKTNELLPENAGYVSSLEQTVLSIGEPVESIERTTFDGEDRWWHAVRFPFVDPEGTVMIGGIAYDVTDIVDAERSLLLSERKYRQIVETAREGIVTVDNNGAVTFANEEAVEMLGRAIGEIVKRPVLDLIVPSDRERARRLLSATDDMSDIRIDLRFQRKDGSSLTTLAMACQLSNGDNNAGGILLMFCDITHCRHSDLVAAAVNEQLEGRVQERTRDLARAIDQLEHANDLLKQFLADASHDIRTPLTIVQAEIDLLLRTGSASTNAHESLLRIRTEAQRMDDMVDDLLFLSRLDGDSFEMRRSTFSIDEVILDTISKLRTLSSQKDIAWNIDFTSSVRIECDRFLIERALENVIENAVKYSPAGSVVHVTMRHRHSCVFIIVADEGPGIAEGDLPKIFERFYRAERTRTVPGTGLGLAIVKSAVEACGGRVCVDSKIGRGTTVTMELPCA